MKTSFSFSRRGPDLMAEELAVVLSSKQTFEFKALFLVVHGNLRARNQASGGEEMLRLRAYEKLQNFVQAGLVKKVGKEYRGVPAELTSFLAAAAEMRTKFAPAAAPAAAVPVPTPVVAAPVKATRRAAKGDIKAAPALKPATRKRTLVGKN